jgi:ribosome-associated translation inhibitor RaiA
MSYKTLMDRIARLEQMIMKQSGDAPSVRELVALPNSVLVKRIENMVAKVIGRSHVTLKRDRLNGGRVEVTLQFPGEFKIKGNELWSGNTFLKNFEINMDLDPNESRKDSVRIELVFSSSYEWNPYYEDFPNELYGRDMMSLLKEVANRMKQISRDQEKYETHERHPARVKEWAERGEW